MAGNVVRIVFKGDSKGIKQASKQATDSLKTVEKQSNAASSAIKRIAAGAAGVFGLAKAFQSAVKAVEAFGRQEQQLTLFDNAMKSMGRSTRGLRDEMILLAQQIQQEGIIGDEASIEASKFLATFSKISDEHLPRALQLAADFAAFTGNDVKNAATLLGKASEGMVAELKRYGISVSEATMKSKDFVALMGEIEQQVGGANKVLGETSFGAVQKLSNAFGDLSEAVGGVIMQHIENDLRSIIGLTEDLTDWVNSFSYNTIAEIDARIAELRSRMASVASSPLSIVLQASDYREINDLLHKRQKIVEQTARDEARITRERNAAFGDLEFQIHNAAVADQKKAEASLAIEKERAEKAAEIAEKQLQKVLQQSIEIEKEKWEAYDELQLIHLKNGYELFRRNEQAKTDELLRAESVRQEIANGRISLIDDPRQRELVQAHEQHRRTTDDIDAREDAGELTAEEADALRDIADNTLANVNERLQEMPELADDARTSLGDLFTAAAGIDVTSFTANVDILRDGIRGLVSASLEGSKSVGDFARQWAGAIAKQIATASLEFAAVASLDVLASAFGLPRGSILKVYYGRAGAGLSNVLYGVNANSGVQVGDMPSYHGGGVVSNGGNRTLPGLAGDEVPAILQTGERVLSRSQNREYERGGGGGMPKVTVQVINQSGEQLAVTEQTQIENQQARESVISIVVDSMRPGGQVNRAVNANFNGITRRAS